MASLWCVKIVDLVKGKKSLVSVVDTATIGEALKIMQATNVSAIPISAPLGKWLGAGGSMVVEGNHQYIGIVSLLDFVSHLSAKGSHLEAALSEPVTSLFGGTNESMSMWVMSGQSSLAEILEPMSKGVHRILAAVKPPLIGPNKEVKLFMLTQTDVARYLYHHSDELRPVMHHSINDLNLANPKVPPVAVEVSTPVTEALKQMQASGVSAVPVVDQRDDFGEGIEPNEDGTGSRYGRVLATLSGTDFRHLDEKMLTELKQIRVIEFLRSVSGVGVPRPPVTCQPKDTLLDVLASAVTTKVHRVWVTDEKGCLVGVVSFSDVIKVVRGLYLRRNSMET